MAAPLRGPQRLLSQSWAGVSIIPPISRPGVAINDSPGPMLASWQWRLNCETISRRTLSTLFLYKRRRCPLSGRGRTVFSNTRCEVGRCKIPREKKAPARDNFFFPSFIVHPPGE